MVSFMAALVGEPFLLRPSELSDLTDWQIHRLYCAPRNKNGAVIPQQMEPKRTTQEQAKAKYFSMGGSLGISPEKLEAAWRAKHHGS